MGPLTCGVFSTVGNSLMVWGLDFVFSGPWAWVQYLVRELRTCKPCGTTKEKINNKNKKITNTAILHQPQNGGTGNCGTLDIGSTLQGGLYICHCAVGQRPQPPYYSRVNYIAKLLFKTIMLVYSSAKHIQGFPLFPFFHLPLKIVKLF